MSKSESVSTNLDPFVLKGITDFESAMAALAASGITEIEVVGDGFYPLDKDSLVGVPFLIYDSKLVSGDFGDMAVIYVVTKSPVRIKDSTETTNKGLIVDGSTGVREQIRQYIDHGKARGLLCERGLTKSEYDNEFGHGVTFYLS